ncbi:MAG TPA: hypothetical protein VHG91_16890 [Longimicrobium sp.]|nr:hypothetical protein [Longimicrobium sp.]
MTGFSRSPRLLKGAIVGVDPMNPLASVIIFQYNPDSLSRRIAANAANPSAAQGEALRLKGPPQETITASIEIDAADQLEGANPLAVGMGVHPTLASLEMLLYPKSLAMILNEALAMAGTIEVLPPEAPLTLFVWGPARVVPVRITELTIEEEAFDNLLNPIRARVQLSMKVLTYQDLGLASVGGALFMAHQVAKEVMATIGGAAAIGGAVAGSFEVSIG